MKKRQWVPTNSEQYIGLLNVQYKANDADGLEQQLLALTQENRAIHESQCINLNPGTNVMNPKAERLLAEGLGSRPSLGYPGDKYEMGLEAIEKIEVLATQLACDVFEADYAELRVASGAMANLYAFMATCSAGDVIIVPPASIGGHVTHHNGGAAGLFGLEIVEAPVNESQYTIDVDALRAMARDVKPKMITVGASLNLMPHPVAEIREIADEVGAKVLFDAAHLSGMIAGKAWQQPLAEGAHLMTMSTYKSLGGPPSGLIVTNDPDLAERLDQIAFPGLTANFDAAKTAALAMTLLDWQVFGRQYAAKMRETAVALANALAERELPVFETEAGFTTSHQFAVVAERWGGGQTMAKRLREANLLTCGIGLPIPELTNDLNGLRFGTPEIVRWGMDVADMETVADFISAVLAEQRDTDVVGEEVTAFRERFTELCFIR